MKRKEEMCVREESGAKRGLAPELLWT